MEGQQTATPSEILAFTIQQFCRAHNLSRSLYYALRQSGEGPDEMRLRGRIAISREAATRWRAAREG